jgi:lysophospholipase L1-like esterase
MRRLLLLGVCLAATATAIAQGPIQHGSGDPRTLSPTPNCAGSRFYVDDSTQQLYVASIGSPCIWDMPGGTPQITRTNLSAQYLLNEGGGVALNDTSGNGNTATLSGTAPSWLSTLGSLAFASGSQQFVSLPATLNGAKTITVAYSFGPFYANSYALTNNNPSLLSASTSTGPFLKISVGLPTATSNAKMSGVPAIVSATANRTYAYDFGGVGTHIVTYVLGASTDHIYLDGLEVGGAQYQVQGASAGLLSTGNWQIGGSSGLAGSWFAGNIHGIWMWSDEKDAATVLKNTSSIKTWLAQSRNVLFGLTKRPIQKLGNSVTCVGDSITYGGNNGATPWCTGAALVLNDTYTVYNAGVSGAWTLDWMANAEAAGYYLQSGAKQVATVWLGTNDLQGGAVSATVLSSLAQSARAVQAQGYKVIVLPMLSRNGVDTSKNTFDALIQQYWPTFGDSFCNVSADPLLGADGASTNATYFNTTDKTHPTTVGNALIATKVSNCVNELYGSTTSAWSTTSAATYSEAAADKYLEADPTVNAVAVTLPDCTAGYGTLRYVKALNALHAVTVVGFSGSQTIDGSASPVTVSPGNTLTVQPYTANYSSAGCQWRTW